MTNEIERITTPIIIIIINIIIIKFIKCHVCLQKTATSTNLYNNNSNIFAE